MKAPFYILYTGQRFYPLGGHEDYVLTSPRLEDLEWLMRSRLTDPDRNEDWGHIVEVKRGTVPRIIRWGSTPTGETDLYTLDVVDPTGGFDP